MNNRLSSKILIIVILIVLLGGGILAWQYWKISKEARISEIEKEEEENEIKILQVQISELEKQITELQKRNSELEKENTEQKLKIEELQNLIAKIKREEVEAKTIKINKEFTILGSAEPGGWMEVPKEITMIIEKVEKIEKLDSELPRGVSDLQKQQRGVVLIITGKLTNPHKVSVSVHVHNLLRIFDAEKEELYSPTFPVGFILRPESTEYKLSPDGPLYFIVPRDATYLYLRVTDAFGKGIPIELTF